MGCLRVKMKKKRGWIVVGRRIDIPQHAGPTFAAKSMESSSRVTLDAPLLAFLLATTGH